MGGRERKVGREETEEREGAGGGGGFLNGWKPINA